MTADPFATVRREAEFRPFPAAPLLAVIRARRIAQEPSDYAATGIAAQPVGWRTVSAWYAIPRRRAECWIRHGLTSWDADMAAVRLGLHPSAIWPEWWSIALDELAIDMAVAAHRERIRRLVHAHARRAEAQQRTEVAA